MRVIILAKSPVVGKVKTRLMPQYTAEQAAELHQQMVRAVITKVCGIFDDVWLAVDDVNHDFFKKLGTEFEFELHNQGQGNLGSRLQTLSAASFGLDDKSVMFLGSDSPHVHVGRYQSVTSALKQRNIAIGPVEDGGYDLIGITSHCPSVFDNIHWGTDRVFHETMNNISHLGLTVKALDISFDLDRAEDIRRAPPHTW
ncbi:MAG: TIGR04282 family arsenosugar biosynthesis glycosyltransferase [Ghiorsea sp.]|nr:TIGR04282 family arsenosugar biosynthesis glycosyltransferase [Ghiorsea sp.]